MGGASAQVDMGSPSQSLKDYGQAQRLVMLVNLLTGTTIWAVAGLLNTPLATPENYGDVISSIHAEWWAIPLSVGSMLHILGQVVNGDPRLSPWVTPVWRVIGSILCALVMWAFVWGGLHGPWTDLFVVVHYIQSIAVGCICSWFVVLNICDLRSAIRQGTKHERQ